MTTLPTFNQNNTVIEAFLHDILELLLNLCLSRKKVADIFFDESGKLLSWNGNPENFNRPGARADFIACMVSLA